MKWQTTARLIIAVAAIVFAVGVVLSFRRRSPPVVEAPIARTDPKAVVEGDGGQSFRVNREQEQVRVQYDKLLTYPDGTSKMVGVTVTTNRSGRTFTIAAREGEIGKAESVVELDGDVSVRTSDGLIMTTAHATYTEVDGLARAPGFVEFSRGRMSGSGFGFTYDNNRDILSVADEAQVHVVPDAAGLGALDVAAGAMEFRRTEKSIRFEGHVKATRARETIEAETAVAHLGADGEQLEAVELRGNSRITASNVRAGRLQALTGRDVDLTYGPDGQALQRAVINGDARIRLAGTAGQPGRQISANAVVITLAPDGATLTALSARENVTLSLPGGENGVSRLVASQTLEGRGNGRQGLTDAHFGGDVQFSERGPTVNRTVRSALLDVTVSPGFGVIDDARFAGGVRFADGSLAATSAVARYLLERGTLALGGSEPDSPRPHILNEQMAIDADRVDLTLDGPIVKAAGAVKSALQPRKSTPPGVGGKPSVVRLPSMLKQDQPVNLTADALEYLGTPSRATYSGNVLLWQGDTQVKSASLAIEGDTGNLSANGEVETLTVLQQTGRDGQMERVRTTGTANAFTFDDATRRAVYRGDARLRGPQGDLTASTIELRLKPSGDELERVEASDAVELRVDARKTTGAHLTYFGDEGRYVVTGTPMKVLDECGRETTGRTLTFYKSTDRIVADGNDQVRTQTRGTSSCPGT